MITYDQREGVRAFVSFVKENFAIDLVKHEAIFINENGPVVRCDPQKFISEVCETMGIPLVKIKGDRGNYEVTDAKRIICHHLKAVMGPTEIGRLLNNNHSTIINLQKTYTELLSGDKQFREKAHQIEPLVKY